MQSAMAQNQMLRALADQPELSKCGSCPFEKLSMRYQGTAWVIDLEATDEDNTLGSDHHGGN